MRQIGHPLKPENVLLMTQLFVSIFEPRGPRQSLQALAEPLKVVIVCIPPSTRKKQCDSQSEAFPIIHESILEIEPFTLKLLIQCLEYVWHLRICRFQKNPAFALGTVQ